MSDRLECSKIELTQMRIIVTKFTQNSYTDTVVRRFDSHSIAFELNWNCTTTAIILCIQQEIQSSLTYLRFTLIFYPVGVEVGNFTRYG